MDKVIDFNREVLGLKPRVLGLQPPEEAALSLLQLQEEAMEYQEAIGKADFLGCIDAIIDGMYFSYGILYKMGLSEELVDELFGAVHEANMNKANGIKKGREGFVGVADAIKPVNWVDPRDTMRDILRGHIK